MKKLNTVLRQGFWRRGPSPFRTVRSSGFVTLDHSKKIEEERMPAYETDLFYPARLGDKFCERYQILSKLGFGANSTVWFCRDVQEHHYIALKIFIHGINSNREAQVLKHLSAMKNTTHTGSGLVRTMLDAFEIEGPKGKHQCIVFEPLLTSVLHFQATMNPPSLTEDLLKALLYQLFLALDYLHSEAEVIHTGMFHPHIQAKNILIGTRDKSIFADWEKLEETEPSPRKLIDDRVIYKSQSFGRDKGQIKYGLPILSDFGEARIGNVHTGLIQPDIYRAPEVVLGMEWTSKVDIWNMGALVWDLFEDHHLFDGRGPDNLHSNEHLLAEMVAIIGPPPTSFLQKCTKSKPFWDESGQWKGGVDPPDISLEDSEEYLEGENKVMFLHFMRKMLQWDPDKRQNARELLQDPWLNSF